MAKVVFKSGTYEQYSSAVRDPSTLYFIEDLGKIYKGNVDVTNSFLVVNDEEYVALTPDTAVSGIFYVNRTTHSIKVLDQSSVVEIFSLEDLITESGINSTSEILASKDSKVSNSGYKLGTSTLLGDPKTLATEEAVETAVSQAVLNASLKWSTFGGVR